MIELLATSFELLAKQKNYFHQRTTYLIQHCVTCGTATTLFNMLAQCMLNH